MKKYVLHIIIFFCCTQFFYSQEDGVVALALPVRNSLKFNKYAINPAFSFVREQNKYISFSNKREWVQFANPPQTYLFSYAGRFGENIGAGVGLFQQNYGVLTTFGGLVNFAYNAVFDRDSNLTFGMNLGFYQSGINQGSVITNFPDPSIENIPTNSVITVNPGINYGLAFLDFGISINNLVAYNLNSNKMIENNPEQSFQTHIMYTGYFDTRGFFDESKFSGLIRSEFKKDKTVLSGIMMVTVPKGIWAQIGYNTLYGASAGIGLNITTQIALEYNYEQALGDLVEFGNSHEITLAYRFKNKNKYTYSGDDDETALIAPTKKKRRSTSKTTDTGKTDADFRANRIASAQIAAERKARLEEEARLNQEAEAKATEEDELQQAAEDEKLLIDETTKSLEDLTKLAEQAKIEQEELLTQLEGSVASKQQDLKGLREENDLIEQGIIIEPKPLKSLSAENAAIEALVLNFDKAIQSQKLKIAQLENLYSERLKIVPNSNDSVNQFYADAIEQFKTEQQQFESAQENIINTLKEVEVATDIERKVRIEQVASYNEEDRLQQVAEAETKAKQEEQVRLAAEAAAIAKAEEDRLRQVAEAEAKSKQEEQERLAAEAEAIAKAEEDELQQAAEDENIPIDETAKSMEDLTKLTEQAKIEQVELLNQLEESLAIKQQDLKDLKEENDLSEQGIIVQPKPFKSVSAENAKMEALIENFDKAIQTQNSKIAQLENLYSERNKTVPNSNDSVNQNYADAIEQLKTEQQQFEKAKEDILNTLEEVKVATEIERKRRIKRATYDNEQDRYLKDRNALNTIKQNTSLSETPLTFEDFDFGEEQSNVQIIKGVSNVESGFYMVLAVHTDIAKRDEFLTKVVAAGQKDIDFFYDVSSGKYFIYYEKYDDISGATRALETKGTKVYNSKMSMVKIEN
jgi:type IX secretion system PorP/SprF family membrane protein